MALAIAVVALAALAAGEAVALIVVYRSRHAALRELEQLRASVRESPAESGPIAVTGRVIRAVVDNAARLGEHGVQGMLTASIDDLVRWARDNRPKIVRVAGADGTTTFFFSDIETSTALNEQLGDRRWHRVLEAHDALVRGRIVSSGGVVVKTMGDGFMAVFGDPTAAVQAAIEIQQRLGAGRIRALVRTDVRVRIGLHRGAAVASNGDYIGRDVALCARIAEAAAGGEIFLSDAVRAALGETAPPLEPCGELQFKGISGPVEVWSVRAAAAASH